MKQKQEALLWEGILLSHNLSLIDLLVLLRDQLNEVICVF